MYQISLPVCIVIALVCAVISAAIAFFAGVAHRKKTAEFAIHSAEDEAKRIVSEAIKTAEAKKKEAVLEGKDEIHRQRAEAEKELNDRRKEVQRQERRIQQKEETLDKKIESLEAKDEILNNKNKQADERLAEAEAVKKSQFEMLERISGFTVEQAKDYLMKNLEDELTHEKAVKLMEFEQQTREDAEASAREIISMAIQRCAADHVAEATISVVPLPNDEMKGRIIGREGRNIRAIETLTGVDLIIDDTPEAITLSSFEPVRREVARIALEKLIADGRIHPARIEEMIEKARREVDATIKQEGERAVIEAGVNGIHPELVKLLGRLRYRTSYGQNVLNHSLEVAYLSGVIASELGLDPTIARRAGLLHDIARRSTTKSRVPMWTSASMWHANIKRARRLSTQFKHTTAMWRPRRSLPALYRPRMPFPPQGRARGVKIWKITSNVWRNWKRWLLPSKGSSAAMRSRQAARSASW